MRLLLAEDEVELAKAIVTILRHSHYEVDVVYNGQDAYDYLLTGNYDGAILDVMMPKMNGITVVQSIRKKGVKLPILLLTAKSEIDDRVLGLDAGADDYLTKPFAMKELLARIRAMVRRRDETFQTVMMFGNVTLNPNTYELFTEKGVYRLTNKEYQLMECFMMNPNHVLSTERLMEKIWGYETEVEVNVIWVNISYLRRKLQTLGANIRIKVNRGIGYSLEIE